MNTPTLASAGVRGKPRTRRCRWPSPARRRSGAARAGSRQTRAPRRRKAPARPRSPKLSATSDLTAIRLLQRWWRTPPWRESGWFDLPVRSDQITAICGGSQFPAASGRRLRPVEGSATDRSARYRRVCHVRVANHQATMRQIGLTTDLHQNPGGDRRGVRKKTLKRREGFRLVRALIKVDNVNGGPGSWSTGSPRPSCGTSAPCSVRGRPAG